MREREREIAEQAQVEGMKAVDMSAEERFINRSYRIRRKIVRWVAENVGQLFETEEVMASEAGNFAKCSSITARRWIHQFTAANTPYRISEQDAGYVIQRRITEK